MAQTPIRLTNEESDALTEISRTTGKSGEELVHNAIGQLIAQILPRQRLALLRTGRGLWKERTDLPPLQELRDEMDRAFHESIQ
ncbi:MAG TPA: CopG family transcriptional regulator [Blastocatellia bacterium]|nr:CopG family transcriptional regulator [Blastocatellia bacterium]